MLPRAQDIAQLVRHWLKAGGGEPTRDSLGEAVRALQELLGATGGAVAWPDSFGFVSAGDLVPEGSAELASGTDGISRKSGLVIRCTAADGDRRVIAVFRFQHGIDEAAMAERIASAADALLKATAPFIRKEAAFGDYQVLAKLGEGGMGQLHVARGRDGQLVALKRISRHLATEPRFLELFSREVQAAARIAHPNVVRILEFGVSDEQAFLVMELLRGASLARLALGAKAAGLELPAAVVLGLALQYCDGLAAAHAAEVIHCDVCPQNLFVTFEGEAKLIDFGVARTAEAERRRERARGRMGYVAPELLLGAEIDDRVDVFALGVVLHELLSGTPVEGSWRTYAGSGFPPLRIPGLAAVCGVVMHAVAFDRAHRPAGIAPFRRALFEAAASDGVPLATPAEISRFMRAAMGDAEAQQKRLLSGVPDAPVGPNTHTARLD